MEEYSGYVGLDVHKDTIAVAVAYPGRSKPKSLGIIANAKKSLLKLIAKLSPNGEVLGFCYEASSCGYEVCRWIKRAGHDRLGRPLYIMSICRPHLHRRVPPIGSRGGGLLAVLEFRARRLPVDGRVAIRARRCRHLPLRRHRRHEGAVFRELVEFYHLSPLERRFPTRFAGRYSVSKRGTDAHVRNPASGQWREHFTPRVLRAFDAKYKTLIGSLGYPAD